MFAAFGGDDVLNGSCGGDSYQFMGNFGKDKVLEYGTEQTFYRLERERTWFERLGRRGYELKVTVNDEHTWVLLVDVNIIRIVHCKP